MNCEKASVLAQKAEDKSLSFFEKFRLKFHIFLCGPCKWFNNQNTLLSKAVAKMYSAETTEINLSDSQKHELIRKVSEK